jgi:hypothetical protein
MSVEISGKMSAISVTPVITAGAYSAGQIIGGLMKFQSAFHGKQSGILHGLTIADKSGQSSAMDLIVFNQKPAGTYTDGAAFSPTSGDLLEITGHVNVLAGNYSQFSANSEATVSGIGLPVKNVSIAAGAVASQYANDDPGRDLWAVLVARGTPTYVSTSDLTVTPKILQD